MSDSSGLFKHEYEPNDWAIPYHLARKSYRTFIAFGGTGSSKTHTNKMGFLRGVAEDGGYHIAIASTMKRSKVIQQREILKVLAREAVIKVNRGNEEPYIVIRSVTGETVDFGPKTAQINFEGSDGANVGGEGKKRGIEIESAWFTEVCPDIKQEMDGQIRLRSRMAKNPRFYYDTNPEDQSHWLIEKYFPKDAILPRMGLDSHWEYGTVTDKVRGIYWQSLTIMHNKFMPEVRRKEMIDDAGDTNGYWYKRMILGHPVAPEGAVFGIPAFEFARSVSCGD